MREVEETARPRLGRGVRLQKDPARGGAVLLAPERVLNPSATAIEILRRCDGARTVTAIIDDLAAIYATDRQRIAADVLGLLAELAAKRVIEL